MSEYFKNIYERANVQQLRSFLIFGDEDTNGYETMMKKAKNYEGRIKKINKETREVIDSKISDRDDREEVMNKVMEYVCETDDIHTEKWGPHKAGFVGKRSSKAKSENSRFERI